MYFTKCELVEFVYDDCHITALNIVCNKNKIESVGCVQIQIHVSKLTRLKSVHYNIYYL